MLTKKILFIAHVTKINGPVQAFIKFLSKNTVKSHVITHPMPIADHTIKGQIPSKDFYSEYFRLSQGKKQTLKKFKNLKPFTILNYFIHLIYSIIFVYKNKFDLIVAADVLNAFSAIIMKKLGITKKVAFYVIDYSPVRFYNKLLNFIYHKLDRFCVRNSDIVWNISEKINQVRLNQSIKKSIVVPVGVYLNEFNPVKNWKDNDKVIVYAGALSESKGVQLLIGCIPNIIKKVPDAKFSIIGDGPYKKNIIELINKNNLQKNVKLFGFMDREELLYYLSKCRIGVAPYQYYKNSYTIYADPTKPKEYMACGLPIIITDVPSTIIDVKKDKLGIVIKYNTNEFVNAVVNLITNDKLYVEYRENALKYMANYTWDKIYTCALKKSF